MQKIEIDLTQIPEAEKQAFFDLCRQRGIDPGAAIVESMRSIVRREPLVIATAEESSEWVSTEEARKMLGYKCVTSVLRQRRLKRLQAAEYPKKPYFFKRADVEALMTGSPPSAL